jgi:hypothetical protein
MTMQDVKPIKNFRISKQTLEQLPPAHKLAVMAAIQRGAWILVDDEVKVGGHSK